VKSINFIKVAATILCFGFTDHRRDEGCKSVNLPRIQEVAVYVSVYIVCLKSNETKSVKISQMSQKSFFC
jgi:hypothetical protein